MSTATKAVHTPGDVNHKFLAAAGYDFCTTCGSSLRGKRTALETEMLEALLGLLNLTDQGREGGLILSRADQKPITNGDQDIIESRLHCSRGSHPESQGRPMSKPMRGIINGLLIVAPFWLLVLWAVMR